MFAPTRGLGERSHLAHLAIDLSTHVDDVVNEIRWKDLDRIVLVGHSYGGIVITGVAERVCDRIASIVYVDAFIPGGRGSVRRLRAGLEPGRAGRASATFIQGRLPPRIGSRVG